MAELTPEELKEVEEIRRWQALQGRTQSPLGVASSPVSPAGTPASFLQTLKSFTPPRGVVGGTLGGILGAGLGGMAGGIGVGPGGVLGAGLGAAGEENLRQMLSGEFQPLEVGKEAAAGGVSQLAGEAVFSPLRYALNRRALTKATRAAQETFERAKLRRVEEVEKRVEEVEKATATHELLTSNWKEQGATIVADAWKAAVPAWKDLPTGTRGVQEMVLGQGQDLLGASFDKAMKEVVAAGRGQDLIVPLEAAQALGLSLQRTVASLSGTLDKVVVDAGEAAAKAVGFWKKDHQVYRQVVNALDALGLGNNAARQEYMKGQAIIQFVSDNKIVEGGVYHPDRVLQGITTTVKRVNALRKRGMGDVFRGPFAQSLEGQPSPLQRPLEAPPGIGPPPKTPLGFQTHQLPGSLHHPWILSGVGAGLGHHYGGIAGGVAGALGGVTAGELAGKEIVTRTPREPAIEALLHLAPTLAAQYFGAQYFGMDQ